MPFDLFQRNVSVLSQNKQFCKIRRLEMLASCGQVPGGGNKQILFPLDTSILEKVFPIIVPRHFRLLTA